MIDNELGISDKKEKEFEHALKTCQTSQEIVLSKSALTEHVKDRIQVCKALYALGWNLSEIARKLDKYPAGIHYYLFGRKRSKK